jgi:hypothetical protein
MLDVGGVDDGAGSLVRLLRRQTRDPVINHEKGVSTISSKATRRVSGTDVYTHTVLNPQNIPKNLVSMTVEEEHTGTSPNGRHPTLEV